LSQQNPPFSFTEKLCFIALDSARVSPFQIHVQIISEFSSLPTFLNPSKIWLALFIP
jgi:hypothetical protein